VGLLFLFGLGSELPDLQEALNFVFGAVGD